MKKQVFLYVVTSALAGSSVAILAWLQGYSSSLSVRDKCLILADSFTLPALGLLFLFALVWISDEGFFDGIGYIFKQILPLLGQGKKENYYEYKVKKNKTRKKTRGYSFLFFVGFAFFLIAIPFIFFAS